MNLRNTFHCQNAAHQTIITLSRQKRHSASSGLQLLSAGRDLTTGLEQKIEQIEMAAPSLMVECSYREVNADESVQPFF